ncbi:MAG: DUF4347 domain-containing protein, partial [Comamonas sp.]
MNSKHRTSWNRMFAAGVRTLSTQGASAPSPAGLASSVRPLALEQRFMFDGAGAVDVAQAAPDAPAHAPQPQDDNAWWHALAVEPTAPVQRQEIVFVDDNIANYQQLVDGLQPGTEVVVLDGTRDGLEQIAHYLEGRSGIDALHILSHGQQAQITLGTLTLDQAALAQQGATLARIGGALAESGDILLYGCIVGEGDTGERYIAQWAALTQADIAASTDGTGAAALGGNWVLEKHLGQIEADKAIGESGVSAYEGLLLSGYGTMDGDWDFGGDLWPAVGGFNMLNDKLLVSDFLVARGTSLYHENAFSDGSVVIAEFKAAGGSAGQTFTFHDFSISVDAFSGAPQRRFDELKLVLRDIAGNTIATLQMGGPTPRVGIEPRKVSELINGGIAWNYPGVASVTVTVSLVTGLVGGAGRDIHFESMTMSNNVAPAFIGPNFVSMGQNGMLDLGYLLRVSDTDVGQTLVWSAFSEPSHGTLVVSGSIAESGSTSISPGGTLLYTPAPGFAGPDSFTVQVNDGKATATHTIFVEVIAPPAPPGRPDLQPGSDTGISASDDLTNARSLSFSGTSAAGPGGTVQVFLDLNRNGQYDNNDSLRTAVVNSSSGNWTVSNLSLAGLADGIYHVYAIALSAVGQMTSVLSPGLSITLDTAAPGTPPQPVLDAASDTGASSSDGITTDTTPLITGTAEAGSTVTLYDTDGTTVLGNQMTGDDGAWGIQSSALDPGVHSLTASAVDAAGNVSAASLPLDITVVRAPVISGLDGDATRFTEDGSQVLIDANGDAAVTSSAGYAGGSVTAAISGGGVAAEDVLRINHQGNGAGQIGVSGSSVSHGGMRIGTYAGGTGGNPLVITLDAAATSEAVAALLRNLAYFNTNQANIATADRTIEVTVSDAVGTSDAARTVVSITAVDDLPVITLPGTQVIQPNTRLEFKDANNNAISVSDVDDGELVVHLMVVGTLSLGSDNVTLSEGTGTYRRIALSGSQAHLNALLQTLTFQPDKDSMEAVYLYISTYSGSPGPDTPFASTALLIDVLTPSPKVTSVLAQGSDRVVKIGDQVLIDVNFDQIVWGDFRGGWPILQLETGLEDRHAVYSGGAGTSTLTFRYTVQAGDRTDDLDFQGISALKLNGAVLSN